MPRRPHKTEALVWLRCLSPCSRTQRPPHATGHRRGGHGPPARPRHRQVPALPDFRPVLLYDKTGVLTVVISPLVALMANQAIGLQVRGISSCVAINGLLSMAERRHALDKIRLGDADIVLIRGFKDESAPPLQAGSQQAIARVWAPMPPNLQVSC